MTQLKTNLTVISRATVLQIQDQSIKHCFLFMLYVCILTSQIQMQIMGLK